MPLQACHASCSQQQTTNIQATSCPQHGFSTLAIVGAGRDLEACLKKPASRLLANSTREAARSDLSHRQQLAWTLESVRSRSPFPEGMLQLQQGSEWLICSDNTSYEGLSGSVCGLCYLGLHLSLLLRW